MLPVEATTASFYYFRRSLRGGLSSCLHLLGVVRVLEPVTTFKHNNPMIPAVIHPAQSAKAYQLLRALPRVPNALRGSILDRTPRTASAGPGPAPGPPRACPRACPGPAPGLPPASKAPPPRPSCSCLDGAVQAELAVVEVDAFRGLLVLPDNRAQARGEEDGVWIDLVHTGVGKKVADECAKTHLVPRT